MPGFREDAHERGKEQKKEEVGRWWGVEFESLIGASSSVLGVRNRIAFILQPYWGGRGTFW